MVRFTSRTATTSSNFLTRSFRTTCAIWLSLERCYVRLVQGGAPGPHPHWVALRAWVGSLARVKGPPGVPSALTLPTPGASIPAPMDAGPAQRVWWRPAARGPASHRGRRRLEVLRAYALMTPALLLVLGVLGYPLAWEVWVSFTNLGGGVVGSRSFVGLANYRTMAASPEFWRGVVTTVLYFATTTVVKLALGMAMALALAAPSRGRALVFLAVFLPWAYPGGVTVI